MQLFIVWWKVRLNLQNTYDLNLPLEQDVFVFTVKTHSYTEHLHMHISVQQTDSWWLATRLVANIRWNQIRIQEKNGWLKCSCLPHFPHILFTQCTYILGPGRGAWALKPLCWALGSTQDPCVTSTTQRNSTTHCQTGMNKFLRSL